MPATLTSPREAGRIGTRLDLSSNARRSDRLTQITKKEDLLPDNMRVLEELSAVPWLFDEAKGTEFEAL